MNKEEIRIVKVASCPSLSGRSTLTYHIGSKDTEIYIRIFENSEGGLFSKDWVSMDLIELSTETPITSSSLQGLFKGKSSNSPGFIMAVLKKEGLIKSPVGKSRNYMCNDPAPFKAAIVALMESEVVLEEAPETPVPTPPRQKKGRK
jgi:hypothetical protein